jgi:hypothetical protein
MSAAGACKSRGTSESGGFLRARCEVGGVGRDCRIMSLNSNGAFVESFVPATTGSKVTLRFQLPNGHEVTTSGVVRHHEFRVGFGVDFTNLSSLDREQIVRAAG